MGLWVESSNPQYITDRSHPIIRREYDRRRLELGLRHDEEMTERERRAFDRDMVHKYGWKYPVPGYVEWLLKVWEFLPAEEGA